ncbi:mitochondrial ubiquinone biosynthesis Coq8 [Andalucia godoyi]|uniref:Mitochondrial ubiquinone biosynthesis Coq8 n=1 Tax=Andalucia godoyi TaxID=505711 RepID=A0A8K0AGK5_ANDGO|nr:mitochondrial ubiquinone biosynthesis Coq8 [Andalucia godoyi]|eukprot:ANDGO_00610.mRNA.1 mitochondrial ubiquinone biosynthesis Coq8
MPMQRLRDAAQVLEGAQYVLRHMLHNAQTDLAVSSMSRQVPSCSSASVFRQDLHQTTPDTFSASYVPHVGDVGPSQSVDPSLVSREPRQHHELKPVAHVDATSSAVLQQQSPAAEITELLDPPHEMAVLRAENAAINVANVEMVPSLAIHQETLAPVVSQQIGAGMGGKEEPAAFWKPLDPSILQSFDRPKRVFQERAVPSSSISRFLGFSGLATRMAMGAVSNVVSNALGFNNIHSNVLPAASAPASSARTSAVEVEAASQPSTFSNFLSEKNAERLAATLCRMRGAALKLGQIISIQDDALIPPQIQKVLDRVRQQADIMPKKQLFFQLEKELGSKWREKFESFDEDPIAAASIGQVHRARTIGGMDVAVKVQYPGVAESIDSDLNNLKRIISVANILPKGMFVDSAIQVARKELHEECDYRIEAQSSKRMKQMLAADGDFYVPTVVDELSTRRVFTSEFVEGFSVDRVAELDQDVRNRVAARLLRLCLRELFEFRFMQTDPNWGNFFYDPRSDRMNLIDFGACREYPKAFVDEYLKVVHSAAEKDFDAVLKSSRKLGFLTGDESDAMNRAHVEAVMIVGEPFSHPGIYDFKRHQATKRINKLVPTMLEGRLTPPPIESYSLHRKLSGAFLTCFRLNASIPCRDIFMETYTKYQFDAEQSLP